MTETDAHPRSAPLTHLWTAMLLACLAPAAHAQAPDARAAADALFDDAKVLVEKGDYAAACPKFEASLKLDDAAIGTRLNLGDCYEKLGKLASAWSMYRAAGDRARIARDPREQLASERARALEPRLPHLTVQLDGAAPPGLAIVRDGVTFELPMLGTAIAVDPGTTRIVVHAPGYTSYETTLELAEAQSESLTLPPLARAPVAKSAVIATYRDPKRVWTGVAVAGGGVGLITGGLLFGLSARSNWNEAFDTGACDRETRHCGDRGQALTDTARSRALLSTLFVGGGVVAIGIGAYVALSAPKREHLGPRITPAVAPGSLGLAVSGGF